MSALKPSSSRVVCGANHRRTKADGRSRAQLADARMRGTKFLLEQERVVLPRLDLHEETVERGHVHAGRVETTLDRLHERRPGACEGIEHVLARPEVAPEQHLDELRDELPEIRMQPVHVLRPHALRQVSLRPGERQVDVGIEGVLRQGHLRLFDAARRKPRPRMAISTSRSKLSAA